LSFCIGPPPRRPALGFLVLASASIDRSVGGPPAASMATAATKSRRPARLGLGAAVALSCGAWAALSVCSAAWVGLGQALRGGSRTLVLRRASGEVWMSDVSPKGKAVMKAYQELCSLDNEDANAVGEIMNRLDADQKAMMKALIEARGGEARPIETTIPEVGDTVERLFKKYKMIEQDDDAVVEWRAKMEMGMLKDVQYLIERDQMVSADEEAAKELPDEADAAEAWRLFNVKFEAAGDRGDYMGTPTRKEDIMYRFRRLKENLNVDSKAALEIIELDSTPMVVDPLFVRRTYKAMVSCIGEEEALNEIVRKHPGALMVQARNVEEKISQIKMGSAVIGAFADMGKMFR